MHLIKDKRENGQVNARLLQFIRIVLQQLLPLVHTLSFLEQRVKIYHFLVVAKQSAVANVQVVVSGGLFLHDSPVVIPGDINAEKRTKRGAKPGDCLSSSYLEVIV